MIEISPPMDHVEIAVSAVTAKLESVIVELRGLMQAETFAMMDAFDRAKAIYEPDKADDAQGSEFKRIGGEYNLHLAAFRSLQSVGREAGGARCSLSIARDWYRTSRGEGELAKLLALFESQDKKTKE
ncbi:hypothetical protein GUK30_32630 [Rhizobium leguminosarum]|uniref:hypothetical protein n=1 Tax=Rhizobium ruizarguesonis TaxID=2081791 RepID=UPI0013C1E924|nr:hypothetical protein [Rhizobium ruizarguesonis]NEI24094.1 hypothetical protein [Rhizobium ruizarguesonis]